MFPKILIYVLIGRLKLHWADIYSPNSSDNCSDHFSTDLLIKKIKLPKYIVVLMAGMHYYFFNDALVAIHILIMKMAIGSH